jgi:hypothetical protein
MNKYLVRPAMYAPDGIVGLGELNRDSRGELLRDSGRNVILFRLSGRIRRKL